MTPLISSTRFLLPVLFCGVLVAGCSEEPTVVIDSQDMSDLEFYDKTEVKSVVQELLRNPSEAPAVIDERLGEARPGAEASMSEEELDAHRQIDHFVEEVASANPEETIKIKEALNSIQAAANQLP